VAQKYYAVKEGRRPGIYLSWEECRQEVEGFSGAEYKSFGKLSDAKAYLAGGTGREEPEEARVMEAWVDGSFDAEAGAFSCGVLMLYGGEEKTFSQRFEDPEMAAMRNVAGEIRGSEAAMALARRMGMKQLVIYHDYEGIAKWCSGEWKARKPATQAYKTYYDKVRTLLDIRFVKVKSHSGDANNDRADELAKEALGLAGAKKPELAEE